MKLGERSERDKGRVCRKEEERWGVKEVRQEQKEEDNGED